MTTRAQQSPYSAGVLPCVRKRPANVLRTKFPSAYTLVAFESYAEKLSAEAAELRSKIGKEQRESKRLGGLVSITSHTEEFWGNFMFTST